MRIEAGGCARLKTEGDRANVARLAYVGSKPGNGRDSDAWYTPRPYVEAARAVMGGIDLDPFSSAEANERIGAHRFFDVRRSAFASDWNREGKPSGVRVWMNPPYSGRLIGRATAVFLENLKAGNIEQAIVLVNNATDTRWFKDLRESCAAACLTDHRIQFVSVDGKSSAGGNTRGQCFFYFGPLSRAEAFKVEFAQFGWCVS